MQGSKTNVVATAGSATASTTVTVHFTSTTTGPDNGTPLPANPGDSFTGTATPARAPKLAYPNNNTMLPSNLALLDVHWEPGPSNTPCTRSSFESATTDISICLALHHDPTRRSRSRSTTDACTPRPMPRRTT